MNITDDIKKQARAAVFDRETSAYVRAFGFRDVPDYFSTAFRSSVEYVPETLSEKAKRQALDAVRGGKMTPLIKLMPDTGPVHAPATPSRATVRAAAQVNRLYQLGIGVDAVHPHVTKDDFEPQL